MPKNQQENQQDNIQGFDDAPRAKFKFPKWAMITAVIITIIAGIGLVIPSFLDQAKYKSLIISKVEAATGYKVSWSGDLGIAVLPVPHVTIHDATVMSGNQKIISVKRAEVSIALMPLLHKNLQISSVQLEEPDIALIVDANGRQTWMTDRLNAEKEKSEQEDKANQASGNSAPVSFDKIEIKKGHILYKDEQNGSSQDVSNLDLVLQAKSLAGPFDIKSSLTYNGSDLDIKGSVGEIVTGKATVVDLDVRLPKLEVSANYKGDIVTGDSILAKGDLKLSAKNIEKTIAALSKKENTVPAGLNGKLELTAAILFDGDQATLKSMQLAMGDLSYKGDVSVTGLKTNPAPVLSIDISSTTQKLKTKDTLMKILSELSVKGSGSYVGKTINIQNGSIGFEGQVINLAGSYTPALTPKGRASVNAAISATKIDLDDLREGLQPVTESAAQKAVDERTNGPSPSVKGISLPIDGAIKANIGSLTMGGKTYSNVNADILARGNAVSINNFSLGTVATTTIAMKGQIADTEKLSGFNINANLRTSDVEGLAKAYSVALPVQQTLGAAAVNGNFTGSLEKLGFNATVDALNFAVTAAGAVSAPTTAPEIQTLNLHIRHPSLQSAVRNFSAGFDAPGNFNGPLDISTILSLKDKKYDLTSLKGQLGAVAVAGNISADMSGAKPAVKGALNFGSMVFASPAPAADSSGDGNNTPSSSSNGEGRWSREAINTEWMNKFNADLKVGVASITQGFWKLSNANLAFQLNDGSLKINNMDANLFGGSVAISGNMKGGNAKSPLSMDWTANAKTINAQQLLSAVQNKSSDTVTGTIQNFNLDVTTSGVSPAALVYALSGKGSADGKNLVVKGVDAAKLADAARGSYKPLERAGSLFGSFKDGQTSFSDFNMAYNISNGVVNFSEIKFDGPQATLASTGNVNLPRWTVDLKNKMTVKNSEVPPFDFAISGPLDHPLQAGGSVIENFLRQKAQAKIQNLIEKKLGDKLGLPAGIQGGTVQPATAEPAAAPTTADTTTIDTTVAPAETTAPLSKQEKKAQQIQEGVKALQGLFGK